MKYEAVFISFFEKQTIFMTDDARRFLLKLGADEPYIRLMLHNMVKSGQLYRIKNGVYTFHRNEEVVGFAFRPFYYGLEYALTIRRIWTQRAVPVIITKSTANPGIRELLGIRVNLHRIRENMFFGFDYVNYGGIYVPVSDPEKTMLDFIYYGIRPDRDTMSVLRGKVNEAKLKEYAERIAN